jgi:hypothetical protein
VLSLAGGYKKVLDKEKSVLFCAGEKKEYVVFRLARVLSDEYVLIFGGGKNEYSLLKYKRLLKLLRVLKFALFVLTIEDAK